MNNKELMVITNLHLQLEDTQAELRKTKKENLELKARLKVLDALEGAGVDNWEDYEIKLRLNK